MSIFFGNSAIVQQYTTRAPQACVLPNGADTQTLHASIQDLITNHQLRHIAYSCPADDIPTYQALFTQYPGITFEYIAPTEHPRITVGIVTYNSKTYIFDCLKSLLEQDYPSYDIVVLDNASTDGTTQIIRHNFPQIRCISQDTNIGFSAGHNVILRDSETDFYACLNPDMIFERDFLSQMIQPMLTQPTIGSVAGKVKRWHVTPTHRKKTNIIDTTGLLMTSSHRFTDRGSGQGDMGQYDTPEPIFGVSGAAALYRRQALDDIAYTYNHRVEYFDELFFAYKEDIDIAYRLQWAGWTSWYQPTACSFHDRTALRNLHTLLQQVKTRRSQSSFLKKESTKNEYFVLQKNFSPGFSFAVRFKTNARQTLKGIWADLLEPKTAQAIMEAKRYKKEIDRKRKAAPRRVSPEDIEHWMQ